MNSEADIVIIGAGIWGLSTAYHLAKTGTDLRILVIERNEVLADETTKQAAGQIGQLRSDPLMIGAVGYTLNLLTGFKEQTGHDPFIVQSGSLHLALSEERMESFVNQLSHATQFGIEAEVASDKLIKNIAPAINRNELSGAIHVPGDAYVDAHSCAIAYASAAKDLGVGFALGTEVTGLDCLDESTKLVITDKGQIESLNIISCTGPWSARIAGMAGIRLPMVPIRLQQARTVEDPQLTEGHPVIRIPDKSAYLRPEEGGYLFGVFDQDPMPIDIENKPAGFSTKEIEPEKKIINELRESFSTLFPKISNLGIAQYRQGMVTCSPDAGYVIGPVPTFQGLWIATGCGGMGVAGSGAVGKWLSESILGGRSDDDISALCLERFKDLSDESLTEKCCQIYKNYYALNSLTYSIS